MTKEKIIKYLTSLSSNELGDILVELGAFRSRFCIKSDIENRLEIDLYYEEYKNTALVDVFVIPNTENQKSLLNN